MKSVELKCVSDFAGGADVLYNRFNVTASSPPENPPRYPNSEYNCVVDNGGDYWRLSLCNDSHRVVCQSGQQLVDKPTIINMRHGMDIDVMYAAAPPR